MSSLKLILNLYLYTVPLNQRIRPCMRSSTILLCLYSQHHHDKCEPGADTQMTIQVDHIRRYLDKYTKSVTSIRTYKLIRKRFKRMDLNRMGRTYLNTRLHLLSIPYDTCRRMILWCWNSWHQHDRCEQDEDIHQIFQQENTRRYLREKEGQKSKVSKITKVILLTLLFVFRLKQSRENEQNRVESSEQSIVGRL